MATMTTNVIRGEMGKARMTANEVRSFNTDAIAKLEAMGSIFPERAADLRRLNAVLPMQCCGEIAEHCKVRSWGMPAGW